MEEDKIWHPTFSFHFYFYRQMIWCIFFYFFIPIQLSSFFFISFIHILLFNIERLFSFLSPSGLTYIRHGIVDSTSILPVTYVFYFYSFYIIPHLEFPILIPIFTSWFTINFKYVTVTEYVTWDHSHCYFIKNTIIVFVFIFSCVFVCVKK